MVSLLLCGRGQGPFGIHTGLALTALLIFIPACAPEKPSLDARQAGLAGTWQSPPLTHQTPGSPWQTLERVTFEEGRYRFEWLSRRLGFTPDQSQSWRITQWEAGNIRITPTSIYLYATQMGKPAPGAKNKPKTTQQSSSAVYIVDYEIEGKRLVWKEDINLDGSYSAHSIPPEITIYRKVD